MKTEGGEKHVRDKRDYREKFRKSFLSQQKNLLNQIKKPKPSLAHLDLVVVVGWLVKILRRIAVIEFRCFRNNLLQARKISFNTFPII